MTNETRERIRAYKKLLPDMRERVLGVALLLATSVAMMVTASFAWITLSRAPEVTGMQTTVAANGNLEIALATGLVAQKDANGNKVVTPPGESAIGDSSAAQGIVGANTTWGNLVNVSDPSYGLSNIALRPALLSQYNRTDYPLNGATYGEDGRVVTTNDRYGFASYTKIQGTDSYRFAAGLNEIQYGVRAIASMAYKNTTGELRINAFREETNRLYMEAQKFYGDIVSDKPNDVNTLDKAAGVTCITALEGLVTVFAQDKINEILDGGGESNSSCSPYIWYMYQMMLLLDEALEKEGKALLEMANWQAYVASGDEKREKTFATVDQLINASDSTLKSAGVKIDTLASYKTSVTKLQECIDGLKPMAEKCKNPAAPEETYTWNDIAEYVNILVDVNSTSMNGVELQNAGLSNATTLVRGGKVEVKKGQLVEIEKRFVDDAHRVQANVSVKVKSNNILVSLILRNPVKGTVYTTAYGNVEPAYTKDLTYTEGLKSGATGDAEAKDTYGMALDVWVRTNYPGAILTLEGSVKYEDKRATQTIDGVEYELYTITLGEEENQIEKDVFKKSDNKWYYVDTLSEVLEEEMGGQTPEEKFVPVVVGYDGENRIWGDWRELLEGGYIVQDATTQGAGSCFVFYASTPTEQAKIMELLESFSVAFMDQNGTILGTAKLNLESSYANQGKVTVPLEMETGVEYTNEEGKTFKGIARLNQNTPMLVTAVVYLNGSEVKNANVLANSELQGQLNIQFGTDSVLIAPGNEELQNEARTITAEVTVNGQTVTNGTIGGDEGLEYKAAGYDATVKLTVEGEQPERISGFFVRVINSSQGTRGETRDFVKQDDGTWVATFKLTNPGTYAFNTLIVDGVQYTLHDGSEMSGINQYYPPNRPYVHIRGLRVDSVRIVGVTPGTHMTADSSIEFPVEVVIDSAVPPKQVSAQFFNANDSKQYTAILSYDSLNGKWTGSANISSSDTYTLKYISVDGTILDVPATGSYTLYLGLTASVSAGIPASDWRYMYDEAEPVQIPMYVQIFDDGHKAIPNLTGVTLHYNNIISPASMTWTGSRYEGVFEATNPGEMTFKLLDIGEVGDITNVSGAPVFTAVDANPVEFMAAIDAEDKATVIGDKPAYTMTIELDHGRTATVWAKMVNSLNNNEVYVKGAHNTLEQNLIVFSVPKEDGVWTITEIYVQDCFDNQGEWYDNTGEQPTAEDSIVFTMSAEDQAKLTTDIVADYSVKVYYDVNGDGTFEADEEQSSNKTHNLTGTPENPEGILFNGYTPNKIGVAIVDYAGRAVDGITGTDSNADNKWVISYDAATDVTYGGYDGASLAEIDAKFDVEENVTIGNVTYTSMLVTENVTVNAEEISLVHSGVYTVQLQVKPGVTVESLNISPKFTIATKKPFVKFTATNPTEGQTFDVKKPGQNSTEKLANDIYNDGYSATIYFQAVQIVMSCGQYASSLTATLYDCGDAFESAKCVVESNGTGSDIEFEFTQSEKSSTRSVGSANGSTIYPVGKDAQATTLTIDGYTFILDTPLTVTNER